MFRSKGHSQQLNFYKIDLMYTIDLFFCCSATIGKEEIRAKDEFLCIVYTHHNHIGLKASHTLQVEDKSFDKEREEEEQEFVIP